MSEVVSLRMTTEFTVPPLDWITWTIIGFIAFSINMSLLILEIEKRCRSVKLSSNSLKIWPISCMIIGCIVAFDLAIYWSNGICYISYWTFIINVYFQIIFMGFYQLSMLYYCFAESKLHHDKGYPKWIFIIMYSIGVIFMLYVPTNVRAIIHHCGIKPGNNLL